MGVSVGSWFVTTTIRAHLADEIKSNFRRRRYARWRQAGRQYHASGRPAKKTRPQARHTRR